MLTRRIVLGGIAATAAAPAVAASGKTPILIVGGTARTAPEIIRQALAQGRAVTALARRPEEIAVKDPRVKAVKGDAYDVASLAAAMTGKEVVISLIGPRNEPAMATADGEIGFIDLYSVGTANVIFAMLRKGNRRLIVTSSGGTEMIPAEKPKTDTWPEAWVWRARNLYGDMQRMEKIVAGSGLDYVILRPRTFRDEPARHDLKLAVGTPTLGVKSTLTYADFAEFVLAQVEGRDYLGKAVGLYTDKQLDR
jgi:nucleoside-diphosphate-sugar epimerase